MNALRNLKAGPTLVADIQWNFDQLKKLVPAISDSPAAGVVTFLAIEDDGTLHQWQLLAGAGVTFVQDNTLRTITISSP